MKTSFHREQSLSFIKVLIMEKKQQKSGAHQQRDETFIQNQTILNVAVSNNGPQLIKTLFNKQNKLKILK